MAEPKIYTKNYVSADDVITVATYDAGGTKAKLYDRDVTSKFLTSGANADATSVTVQVDFYEGTVAIPRSIDTLILINHNLKTWTYDYWNGSAWVNLYTNAADAATTRVVTHTLVSTLKVRIVVTATQSVNAEKYIGEMVACLLQLDIGQDFSTYRPLYRTKLKEIMLGDGSIHRAYVRATPNRLHKYGASVNIKYLTDAKLATLLSIKETGDPFLWYPESTQRPTEIWLVHWANDHQPQYSHPTYKLAGWDVSMELKEV